MRLKKSTPIFFVDTIEPHLAHWRDRMGYQLTVEVPFGAGLGFVILTRDGQEVMLQSTACAKDDFPEVMKHVGARGVAFYHEVDDLEAAQQQVKGAKLIGGPRTTSYGAKEIFVLDSAGVVHAYSQHG